MNTTSTYSCETVQRGIMQKVYGEMTIGLFVTLLIAADRAQHVHDVIIPALQEGNIVISDRYTYSAIAYQAGGREGNECGVGKINEWATRGVLPDRTYLLDMSVQEAKNRLKGDKDKIELQDDSFYNRVRHTYLHLAAIHPERFCVIDAAKPRKEVWEQIRKDVQNIKTMLF